MSQSKLATTQESLQLNSSLQNAANNGYVTAATRCSILIASGIGIDQLLTKTPISKLWPKYSTFLLDNKFYTMAILTVMCAQYSMKTTSTEGLLEHNEELYRNSMDEEIQQIEALKNKRLQQQQQQTQQTQQLQQQHQTQQIVTSSLTTTSNIPTSIGMTGGDKGKFAI